MVEKSWVYGWAVRDMIHASKMKREHWLLLLLFALNIVIRIPLTPHGPDVVDSTFIWSLANSINDSGYMAWILNPLSLFGVYAASYPSGTPVVLSITSQITGIDTEYVILIWGFILAILGMLASYIMALKISKDYLFAFLTSFIFSTAPIFVEYTQWTATARNLLTALLPLLLWGIFSFNSEPKPYKRLLLLSALVLITLLATHRTAYLLALLVVACIITEVIWYAKEKQYLAFLSEYIPTNRVPIVIALLCISAFLLQFSGLPIYKNIWWDYADGALATGNNVACLLLNMATNYFGMLGILLPIGLIGFLILIKRSEKNINEVLIITTIILFLAVSAAGIYVALILLPLVALLIASVLSKLPQFVHLMRPICLKFNFCRSVNPTKILSLILVVCIFSSVCFSSYMVQRHLYTPRIGTGDKAWMTDNVPCIGIFLKSNGEIAFNSNDGLLASRIQVSTGVPVFSRGYKDINALINGWLDKKDIKVQNPSLGSLRINMDSLFQQTNNPPLTANGDIRAYVANNRILDAKDLGLKAYDNPEGSVWLL